MKRQGAHRRFLCAPFFWMKGLLFGLALAIPHIAPVTAEPAPSELHAAQDAFQDAMRDAHTYIRSHKFYQNPENRASAHAFLAAMALKAIEHDLILDPDFPFFRTLDFRLREGGDNPDQTYFMAPLRGGASYRIWGKRGTERRMDFQTYAGNPYAAGGGRMAGFLDSEALKTAADGSFEVFVSPNPQPGNWLPNPSDGTQILIRQLFSDWAREVPGEVHIDRIGNEGALKPIITETEMAQRLRAAAEQIRVHIQHWPETVARGWARTPVNVASKPFDAGPLGGVPGRWMARVNFELGPDEALLVRTWPMAGNYQGIQLADMWYSSLEYANRQTSLTADQAYRSTDGSYWFVVSAGDPGVQNWLDTMGRRTGVILLRFDGMQGATFNPAQYPVAYKVRLDSVRKKLPSTTPPFSEQQRSDAIAIRRRHVQIRLNR